MKIGFIGTGLMGKPMAMNVLKKFELSVYNRTKEKAEKVIKAGAKWFDNPKELADNTDAVILMLSDNSACENVLLGEHGVYQTQEQGLTVINMSTITPAESIKLMEEAKKHSITYVEAPVSGTIGPAEKGTLKIFFGGEKEVYEKYFELLSTMGDKIYYLGEVGKASQTKLLINANLAVQMAILSETLLIAENIGLDKEQFLDIVQNSAVSTVVSKVKAHNIVTNSFPTAFPLEHMLKDLNYALTLDPDDSMKLTKTTKNLYEKGKELGLQRKDFSAIYAVYDVILKGT